MTFKVTFQFQKWSEQTDFWNFLTWYPDKPYRHEHRQILACVLCHFNPISIVVPKVRSWSGRTGPKNLGGPVQSRRTSICYVRWLTITWIAMQIMKLCIREMFLPKIMPSWRVVLNCTAYIFTSRLLNYWHRFLR